PRPRAARARRQVQRPVSRLRGTNRRQGADSLTARRDRFRLRAADGPNEQDDEPERRNSFHVLKPAPVLQLVPPDQGSRRLRQAPTGTGPGDRNRAPPPKAQSRLNHSI